jgi:hypothetical protein
MKNRLPKTFAAVVTNGYRLSGRAAASAAQPAASTGKRALTAAGRSIGAHPVVSLAAAFITGLIVAKWIKK